MTEAPSPARSVRLGFDRPAEVFVAVSGLVLGAVAAVLLPILVHWAQGRGLPAPGPLRFLASFDSAWLVWGRPVIGAAVGLTAGALVVHLSPVLYVDTESILVEKGDERRRFTREQVGGVYRERGKVVIAAQEGRILFEGDVEGDRDAIRAAFVDHGYPWESD